MKNKIYIPTVFLLLFLGSISASAQLVFTISPRIVEAVKPANLPVFYNYAELTNNTADTLQIRWRKLEGVGNANQVHNPAPEWETAIDDPSNTYNPVDDIETAVFSLAPSGAILDKFIYQLFPNNAAGELYQRISFATLDHPEDSIVIAFDYEATMVDPTGVEEATFEKDIPIFPNPVLDHFQIINPFSGILEVFFYSSDGRAKSPISIEVGASYKQTCAAWAPGVYFLIFKWEENIGLRQVVVKG